jgi:hypothetical protein
MLQQKPLLGAAFVFLRRRFLRLCFGVARVMSRVWCFEQGVWRRVSKAAAFSGTL